MDDAHFAIWFGSGNGPLLDLGPAAAWAVEHGAEEEFEERLTADLDATIFDLEHDVDHGQAGPDASARLSRLRIDRDRLVERWRAACRAADYRAEKLEELDEALDAATATDSVARWGLTDGRRVTTALPPADPPGPLPTASKAAVIGAVLGHVTRFFSAPRLRMLLNAETGARKTGLALRELRGAIEAAKAAGRPHRAIMLVPAHKLGREIEERARAEGINAALFQGRGDPRKADQPCRNLEHVSLARQAGADVRTAVCGPGPGGARCAYRDSCEYFAGLDRAKAADLVIVAHNFLIDPLPAELRHDLAWVIIDEDFSALADRIADLGLGALAPESLAWFPVLAEGDADPEATAELGRLYAMVTAAANASISGYLTADALRAAGFTAMSGAAARMRALTWARKRDPQMRPGMDLEARKVAAQLAAINGQLGAIAVLTHALEAILAKGDSAAGMISVRLDVRRRRSETVLTVRGQKEPAAWLTDLPVLMLNATGRIEDVRRVFPDTTLADVPRTAWEHCEVRQVTGAFGRSGLTPKKRDELRDFIALATLDRPTGLVVTHLAHEHHFAGIAGIATAHHGAIAGIDSHADAEAAFIIGGAFPSPEDVASIAAARGGGVVPVAKPERITRAALLTSGAAVEIPAMAYADPATDAVHRGIYDASIVQAVGRVRPLERTASNPAVVWVFGNVALPFPVTSVQRWKDMKPDRLARMVAGETVWSNAADMAAFRSDLFVSRKAASNSRHRDSGTLDDMLEAVIAIVRNDQRPWIQVHWQPIGRGQHRRWTCCPKGAEKAVRATIEAEHGKPVRWEVQLLTPGREVVPTLAIEDIFPPLGTPSMAIVPEFAPWSPESIPQVIWAPPDG